MTKESAWERFSGPRPDLLRAKEAASTDLRELEVRPARRVDRHDRLLPPASRPPGGPGRGLRPSGVGSTTRAKRQVREAGPEGYRAAVGGNANYDRVEVVAAIQAGRWAPGDSAIAPRRASGASVKKARRRGGCATRGRPDQVVRRGIGVDDADLGRKRSAVRQALEVIRFHLEDPVEVLAVLTALSQTLRVALRKH